jgi:hypothetical protein
VTEQITYYAVVGQGRTTQDPSGLVRRRLAAEGVLDESLTRDLSWKFTDAIYQDERGENFGPSLVEITEGEAEALIEKFREQWCHLAPAPARRPANRAQPRRERKQRVGLPLCAELTPENGGQSFTKR